MSLWATRELSFWFSAVTSLSVENPLSTLASPETRQVATSPHHCMLLTNWCCTRTFFSNFSISVIKSFSSLCISEMFLVNLSWFRGASAANPTSIWELSLCRLLSWKGTWRSFSVDVTSYRCFSFINCPMMKEFYVSVWTHKMSEFYTNSYLRWYKLQCCMQILICTLNNHLFHWSHWKINT